MNRSHQLMAEFEMNKNSDKTIQFDKLNNKSLREEECERSVAVEMSQEKFRKNQPWIPRASARGERVTLV